MRCLDCGATLPEECNCTVDGGPGIAVSGAGTGASPLLPTVDLAAAPGYLSVSGDGLLGEFPDRMLSPPRARIYATSGLGITGPGATITFNTLASPRDDGFWNPANNSRLTMPLDGLFGLGACIATNASAVQDWRVSLFKNGVTTDVLVRRSRRRLGVVYLDSGIDLVDALSVYTEARLVAGDYVGTFVEHTMVGQISSIRQGHYAPVMFATWLSD